MSAVLHARPPALFMAQDAPARRRMLTPAPVPVPQRQLRLQPVSLFLDVNHNRAPSAERFPPFMPEGPPAPATPYPSAPAPRQVGMPMPCTPPGKSKSLGTSRLSVNEERIKALVRRESLPMLPPDRGACLSFRQETPLAPGVLKLAPKGDRGPRATPCPFVSCRHHLYLDVNPESGAINVNFPGLEKTDDEMVDARMGWLARHTTVTTTRRTIVATVKPGRSMGRAIYHAKGKTEDEARTRLLALLRPLVVAQETQLDLSLMEDTCSLDVGDRGEKREARRRMIKLEAVGAKLNVTMEWARCLLEHAQNEAHAKIHDGQDVRPVADDDGDASW